MCICLQESSLCEYKRMKQDDIQRNESVLGKLGLKKPKVRHVKRKI